MLQMSFGRTAIGYEGQSTSIRPDGSGCKRAVSSFSPELESSRFSGGYGAARISSRLLSLPAR
jgi:hypothetical protein